MKLTGNAIESKSLTCDVLMRGALRAVTAPRWPSGRIEVASSAACLPIWQSVLYVARTTASASDVRTGLSRWFLLSDAGDCRAEHARELTEQLGIGKAFWKPDSDAPTRDPNTRRDLE